MDRRRTTIGVIVTALYLAIVLALSWNGRDAVFRMEPNAVGDFLAGIFGPLAVLWLILGYLQQGEELRLSSQALRDQAVELKRSAEQQSQLVTATQAQVAAQIKLFDEQQAAFDVQFRPSLHLTLRPLGDSLNSGDLFEVTISNHGDIAYNVELESDTAEWEFSYVAAVIPSQGKISLQQDPIHFSHEGTFELVLSYSARRGTMYQDLLSLNVLKSVDGSVRAFVVVEDQSARLAEADDYLA